MTVPIVRVGTTSLRSNFMYRSILIVGCLSALIAPPALADPATTGNGAATKEAGQRQSQSPKKVRPATLALEDLAGVRHRPLEVRENRASVVIFVLHDCPISNQFAPEIQRLADEFAAKRVPFYVVHVDPQLSTADAKKHAKDYRYKLPVIIDRKHELVKQLKATTAPEAFVIGPEGKVLYRGRIDDRYAAIGKPRSQVQRQDLRLALSAVVAGKPVEVAETKAIGCYIPELDE
jgi:thiol-disulfide isomerase/thioredoxin